MSTALRKGTQRLLTRGPSHFLRWGWAHFYERFREWQLGIDTATWRDWNNDLNGDEEHVYEPAWYACLDTALRSLSIRPGQDVFLDYGSGKGRVLCVAATHPFRRVIGIELQPELNRLAKQNLERSRAKLCCDSIDIATVDATTYVVPPDVTVIFMYNPFKGAVLDAVLDQVHQSHTMNPREIAIMYLFPSSQSDMLAGYNWLQLQREISTGVWDWVRFHVYAIETF